MANLLLKGLSKIVYLLGHFFNFIRLIPHLIVLKTHRSKETIRYDVKRWLAILCIDCGYVKGFILLMKKFPEFRNLFYYRVPDLSGFIEFLCPKMSTLQISAKEIGKGLFIQHGFATIIAAKSIGENCWINQQVTIGFSNASDCPFLKDNVTISAGAKVIGDVTIGNNSTVGSNAVVVKNVPQDCVVVGVPAYIVKRNGVKVKEPL